MNRSTWKTLLANAVLCLLMILMSGCFRRTSDPLVDEVNLGGVMKVQVVNPIGRVEITGDIDRTDTVQVRISKQVETFSLLGLFDPDPYLDRIAVCPAYENGVVVLQVSQAPMSFLERLFVRVLPKVEHTLSVPAVMATDVKVDVGELALYDLVGDVTAEVNVGELASRSQLGVFGNQSLSVNVGSINIRMPEDAGFRYDLSTTLGAIAPSALVDNVESQRLVGARAAGMVGFADTPSMIHARVKIGNIDLMPE